MEVMNRYNTYICKQLKQPSRSHKISVTPARFRCGFTLVELLVVIAIIGILVAILLPTIQAARESARRAQCINNQKQMALAMLNYENARKFQVYYHETTSPYSWANAGLVWGVLILPYMEEQALFDTFDKSQHMTARANAEAVRNIVRGYVCPSAPSSANPIFTDRGALGNLNPNPGLGLYYPVSMGPTENDKCVYCPAGQTGSPTNYCCQGKSYGSKGYDNSWKASSVGMFGRFNDKRRFSQVTDGLSNTFMLGETLPEHCVYAGAFSPATSITGTNIPLNTFEPLCTAPPECYIYACGFKSAHPGGAIFTMGDGSNHFVSQDIDYRLFNELGTRAGQEVVELP
jgi:prepilin-type N-terminal cleavage/methylation domain-containing protein